MYPVSFAMIQGSPVQDVFPGLLGPEWLEPD